MDARGRALLEELAFGDGDEVRPGDRLRAVELLEAADDGHDQGGVDIARILDGMSEAELWADVDQMAAAHVLEAWQDPDRWPAISQALRQISGRAKDSRESRPWPDRSSTALRAPQAMAQVNRATTEGQPFEPFSGHVTRSADELTGVDPASGHEVGWRRF